LFLSIACGLQYFLVHIFTVLNCITFFWTGSTAEHFKVMVFLCLAKWLCEFLHPVWTARP